MFKVTKEMLKKAVTYMPLYMKESVSKQIAELCLDDIDTAEQNKIGESIIALPHLKGENLTLKNILLLNTLIGYYLDQDMPETEKDSNGEVRPMPYMQDIFNGDIAITREAPIHIIPVPDGYKVSDFDNWSITINGKETVHRPIDGAPAAVFSLSYEDAYMGIIYVTVVDDKLVLKTLSAFAPSVPLVGTYSVRISAVNAYEKYDYYAEDHLLNQIERFKSDPEVKDIVFDLMSDYKDFKKLVDTEIYNAKANANDPIPRLSAAIAVLTAPETISTITEELKKIGEERTAQLDVEKKAINERLSKKKNAISGEKEQ